MADESDPPRKIYGFKPREFERANPAPKLPDTAEPIRPDPGVMAHDGGKIDVRELIRAGAGAASPLGANAVVNRENEVHQLLKEKYERDRAAGDYDLGVLDDSKRLRRIRNYWLAIVAVDVPFGAFAFWVGHEMAIPFVCSIALMIMFTVTLTWKTFFLRTHY